MSASPIRLMLSVVTEFVSNNVLLLGLVSALFFVGTLIALPIVVVRLPADYFSEARPRMWLHNSPRALRIAAHVIKNVLGVIFLLAGLAMLVLPGQGVLTILIGLSLMDFPGKRRLERKLISQPAVFRAINAIRERFGRPPLVLESDSP